MYYAKIIWNNDQPLSATFDDVYFNSASGINESKYVFIQHNDLIERFTNLKPNATFILGETGFGCGINFLLTLALWQQYAPISAKLFFISFEKHPLSPPDLAKILANFPDLNYSELIKQYYLPLPATHCYKFNSNVFLHLVIGDINTQLPKHNFKADAWFFDGFSPKKNNSMWNDDLFKQIAQHCANGCTFATYSSSSMVQRILLNNNFVVKKDKGYHKREMLFGQYNQPLDSALTINNPWYSTPINLNPDKEVIIIGAGLAGASCANSLASRGYKVTIYEKNSSYAAEASGIYQTILYGNFFGSNDLELELNYAGYRYSHYLINSILDKHQHGQNCGQIQLAYDEYKQQQILTLLAKNLPDEFCRLITASEIESNYKYKINYDGLLFKHSTWVHTPSLVQKLLTHKNISVIYNTPIQEISYDNHRWNLHLDNANKIKCNQANLILCNSSLLNKFELTKKINYTITKGQITKIKNNSDLATIISSNVSITPNFKDYFTIGSTFKHDFTSKELELNDHNENLSLLYQFLPQFKKRITSHKLEGEVGIRAHSIDHMPLIGPIADYTLFMKQYQPLSKDKNLKIATACPYLSKLYICSLFGAKGLLQAPLAGEIIANYIDNTPMPCSKQLINAIHPNRLYLKQLISSKNV
jgi:tRNA 5-methylaminomethyl-2-thiouridine biosynthesis bifunctional protein